MGKRVGVIVLVVVATVLGLIQSSDAATYVVGDSLGWVVPPGGPIAYSTWAANKNFVVGDVLVFNFAAGRHDVAEVTKTAYGNCNATSPMTISTTTPTNITLTTVGEHFFICAFDGHCTLGQKLSINVTATSSPLPPVSTPVPTAAPAPTTARTPVTYVVGDDLGWIVPPGGAIVYSTWARDKTFFVGDILVFNFTEGRHDVAEVTNTAFDSCNATNPISLNTSTPTAITLTTACENFFICTFGGHCSLGQKLVINVTATPSPPTPAPTSAPTPAGPTAPTPSGSTSPPSLSSSSPPPPSTTTPTTPSPSDISSPPPSSAPSFVAGGFTVTLLSIVVALLY